MDSDPEATPKSKRYRAYLEPGSGQTIPRCTKWRSQNRVGDPENQEESSSSHLSEACVESECLPPATTSTQGSAPKSPPANSPDPTMPVGSEPDVSHLQSSASESDSSDEEDNQASWFDAEDSAAFFGSVPGEKLKTEGAVTRHEAILLILVFFYTHGLTMNALGDLLTLVNTMFGYFAVPQSVHKFVTMMNGFMSEGRFHFFCPKCMHLLGSSDQSSAVGRRLWCTKCGEWRSASVGKSDNYFITSSVASQLKHILEKFGSKIHMDCSSNGALSDISQGSKLTSLRQKVSGHVLSLLFSTDGSPVFKSSGVSLWPITAFLNELPPKIRFKLPIIAGVWCSSHKVSMTMFFDAFVAELTQLKLSGIRWAHRGREVVSEVFALCACPDTLGRSSLQNLIRFNGFFGCSWCLHPGKFAFNQVRYPTLDEPSALREDRQMRDQAKVAFETSCFVKGVRGPSCLHNLPEFDLVWGFVPDYMHCVCLGVVKQLTEAWLCTKNHAESYYIGQKQSLAVINARLSAIMPPQSISRLPRPLTVRADWKASEWRAWLLFFGVPCLAGVLSREFLSHFVMLSSAIYMLLQDEISAADIARAESLLCDFVTTTEILYGGKFMTSNMHQLLHLAESARCWGPLWAHSAFPFEDWNGRLLKFGSGTRAVGYQVFKRFSVSRSIDNMMSEMGLSAPVQLFCDRSLGYKGVYSYQQSLGGATGLGVGKPTEVSHAQREAMSCLGLVSGEVVSSYQKIVYDGIMYNTLERARKRKDCVVAFDGGFLEITAIFYVTEASTFVLFGKLLKMCDAGGAVPRHMHVAERSDELIAITPALLKGKCVLVHLGQKTLVVSKVPSIAWGD